jgi:hypothetical protein
MSSQRTEAVSERYTYLNLQFAAYIILLIGAFAMLLVGLFGINVADSSVGRVIAVLVGAVGIFFAIRRDYYLPFLGESVMPCAALQDRTPPGATKSVTIRAEPGAKVLYWAAEPAAEDLKHINNWQIAYDRFENAGIVTADQDGKATLRVRDPQPYTVPIHGHIDAHIHYRVCGHGGMLGRVNTVYTGAGAATSSEGFQNLGSVTLTEKNAEQTKRMLQTMGQAVPQINQILSNIQSQFAQTQTDDANGSSNPPATIEEAFRVY